MKKSMIVPLAALVGLVSLHASLVYASHSEVAPPSAGGQESTTSGRLALGSCQLNPAKNLFVRVTAAGSGEMPVIPLDAARNNPELGCPRLRDYTKVEEAYQSRNKLQLAQNAGVGTPGSYAGERTPGGYAGERTPGGYAGTGTSGGSRKRLDKESCRMIRNACLRDYGQEYWDSDRRRIYINDTVASLRCIQEFGCPLNGNGDE